MNLVILGVYFNLYRDGTDFCPRHRHLDTQQLIISLEKKEIYILIIYHIK